METTNRSMETIEVMLVEDHVLVREGTRELLEREPDLDVVAEAGDGEEAIQLASAHHPDVILMDITMPRMDGLAATQQIKASHPEIAILVLTAYDDDQYVFSCLKAGAAGYLLKDASAEDLVKAIRAVCAGESVLHPAITRKVIDHYTQGTAESRDITAQKQGLGKLTERELQVLKLAARGMINREIAGALSISARTVQVHLSNVFGKLQVGSRIEAVLYAIREGWISLQDTSP